MEFFVRSTKHLINYFIITRNKLDRVEAWAPQRGKIPRVKEDSKLTGVDSCLCAIIGDTGIGHWLKIE